MHRAGILFAATQPEDPDNDDSSTAPPCILFLEILNEFTNKLLKQDKRVVMNFLDRRVASAGMTSSRNEDWQPLVLYRNSLLHGESDHPAPAVPTRKAYTRKRARDYNEDDDEDNDDSDADPDFRG